MFQFSKIPNELFLTRKCSGCVKDAGVVNFYVWRLYLQIWYKDEFCQLKTCCKRPSVHIMLLQQVNVPRWTLSGPHALVSGMHTDSGILLVSSEFSDTSWPALKFLCNYVMHWLIFFFLIFLQVFYLKWNLEMRTTADERLVTVSVRRLLNFEECLEFVRLFWDGLIASEAL